MPAPKGNQHAKGCKTSGAPTKYKKEMCKKVVQLCELGATDKEIANFLDIDVATLYRWQHTHVEFCDAFTLGKQKADTRIERSMYQKALGATVVDQQVVKVKQKDGSEKIEVVNVERTIPPDPGMMQWWLKNRKPDEWRDKQEIDINSVNANVDVDSDAEDVATAKNNYLALVKGLRKS